jgi:hypothetical protein
MTNLDLTAMDLNSLTAVELRKVGAQAGVKGAAKGKKADLLAALLPMQSLQIRLAEQELARSTKDAKVEAELAAKYQDVLDAEKALEASTAPQATDEVAKAARRSRMGMVIVAKGTEVHKSETFRAAAEALGWNVKIEYMETGEVDEDDEPIIRHHAVATKGGAVVEGSWIGKAWDYANAGAGIGGKARKVRNLKEALRILQNWM